MSGTGGTEQKKASRRGGSRAARERTGQWWRIWRIGRATALAVVIVLVGGGQRGMVEAHTPHFGVCLTPAHFPKQTDEDVAGMYREAAGLGAYAILNYAWDQPDSVTVAAQMIHFARGFGLSPIVQLSVLDSRGRLAPPVGTSGSSRVPLPA